LPRICRQSKKQNNPQASGAATENDSSQETKFSEVQTESGTHIINVTSTLMPEMNPTLAFENLKVATNKWADSTEIRALHDSGCAATTMSTQAFMKLTDSDKIIITQPRKPIMVQSCTGEITATRGLAELCLQFNGANGQSLLIQHKVIICDKIDFDFI
jgi:hypothetical protein